MEICHLLFQFPSLSNAEIVIRICSVLQSGYDSDVEEQLSKLPAAQQTQITKPREQQHQQKQQQQQKQEKQKPKLSTGWSTYIVMNCELLLSAIKKLPL